MHCLSMKTNLLFTLTKALKCSMTWFHCWVLTDHRRNLCPGLCHERWCTPYWTSRIPLVPALYHQGSHMGESVSCSCQSSKTETKTILHYIYSTQPRFSKPSELPWCMIHADQTTLDVTKDWKKTAKLYFNAYCWMSFIFSISLATCSVFETFAFQQRFYILKCWGFPRKTVYSLANRGTE